MAFFALHMYAFHHNFLWYHIPRVSDIFRIIIFQRPWF